MVAETKVKSLRLTGELWEALEAKAASAGLTCNAFMARVLSEAVGLETPPAAAGKRGPGRAMPARRAKTVRAKAALVEAEAKAAHLAQPPAHTIQVGPKRPVAGALLKRRPRFG